MFFIKPSASFFKQKQNPPFWSDILYANRSNLKQIYKHPFNQQLFKGTLSPVIFGRYLRDDYYYLHEFSSVLQTLSQKSIKLHPDLASHLDYLGKDIISNELSMQQQYQEHLKNITAIIPGYTISSYTAYLSKTALHSELPVALSAVLPCFWIYYQLGMKLKNAALLNKNCYESWIEAYSSPEFIAATQHLATTVTSIAEQSTPEIQIKMKAAFRIAVQFELDFFDEVCVQENNIKLIA
ncbi:TenA family protein [Legionella maioricensis]|uniref:TenA family protein n=1 Tax=Legionella maioricensis TaxID=2896528 RepID=A0A9X2CZE0_9GAMM|nr:TenA family protein [Legionella maioricensis]MCL9683710.1 TenA family protein [Legionella maioricensis]MCL9687484.1 TenA family protein [Legionella maioricensis]